MLHTRVEESSVTFDHRLDLDGRVHLSDEADSNSRGIKLKFTLSILLTPSKWKIFVCIFLIDHFPGEEIFLPPL